MFRQFMLLSTLCLPIFWAASGAAKTPSIDDYRVGVVRYFFEPMGNFNSGDMLVRMAEPGERSRVANLSEKRGKVLMLTFWNRTCQLCRRNVRKLHALQEKLGKDKLEVIAVHGAFDKPFARVETEAEQFKVTDLTIVQARGRQLWQEMQNRIQFELSSNYPPTWIIDTKGDVRFLSDLAMDWANTPEVVALVEALARGEV